jgi:hypothetical protein
MFIMSLKKNHSSKFKKSFTFVFITYINFVPANFDSKYKLQTQPKLLLCLMFVL